MDGGTGHRRGRQRGTAGALAFVAILAAGGAALPRPAPPPPGDSGGGDEDEAWAAELAARKAEARARRKVRGRDVHPEVVGAPTGAGVATPPLPASGFAPQTRLGFTAGDQWEPSIAADRYGHVYVFYPQYLGVPGCPTCPSPTCVLQVSSDGGDTFGAPYIIADPGTGQYDAQIVVDPVDGSTVYAAWLQDGKSKTVVARSVDFGKTWSVAVASRSSLATDKPSLAVRGNDVYVAYSRTNTIYLSSSHDGARTFATVPLKTKLGLPLAAAGAVAPNGDVYFPFGGYTKSGSASGAVNLFLVKSTDGGRTWAASLVDVSGAPPDCPDYRCGYAYLGAQIVFAVDEGGTLHALWNAGAVDGQPERVYFASSTDRGRTFSARQEVSFAPPGVNHAFPAIAAGGAGEVHISWMDARAAIGSGPAAGLPVWNTYHRSSGDGGATWSGERDISTFVPGFSTYIFPEGFRFPFGDYYEVDLDGEGTVHAVFGEGFDYDSPGSIWYTRGR